MMTVCGYFVAKEHHWVADCPNCEYGQHGVNELPCRRFVLSGCFCLIHTCYISVHTHLFIGLGLKQENTH